jgi:superfamily I DNA and/or RNA helicase
MAPSSFFKKKQSLEINLLHHANYYLKHIFLSNHYRSAHPHLIKFSNSHFYNNRLKAFQDTSIEDNPIQHYHIKTAVFTDRKNIIEAQKVAVFITEKIKAKEKLGIVAFSETQLECIYENLSEETKVLLEKRMDEDTLFFQSLEKVQGDECDRLIVSFGYGFNSEKKFEMRFGPVNLNQGHKRLNVLFSRAKRNIDFFSSVTHSDFPKTENEGVIHLKKWFEMLQNREYSRQVEKNISIKSILEDCKGFNDLLSYLNVYQNRGYKINTTLF